MLIAIVLDRPLQEAQDLVDQPLQFLQEIKRVLEDQKSHPVLERMLRTIQGDAAKQEATSIKSCVGRQPLENQKYFFCKVCSERRLNQIVISHFRGASGKQENSERIVIFPGNIRNFAFFLSSRTIRARKISTFIGKIVFRLLFACFCVSNSKRKIASE